MLSQSNLDISTTLQLFKERGIKTGFLVPTETGLQKSIMDAHGSLRRLLKSFGLHDYDDQGQGTEHKRLVPTLLFVGGRAIETQTSFYRPETKAGDPRLWVYELTKYANSGDLLALACSCNKLVVINCSQNNLLDLFSLTHDLMKEIFPFSTRKISPIAEELLSMLQDVHSRGYVRTMRSGDTGVGYTLESLLGIAANSSKAPDYKGIELKAGRIGKQKNRQTTVFSQVPLWEISTLKGSKDIVKKRGHYNLDKDRLQLYHEISCVKPNSYDLQLELSNTEEKLYQIYMRPNGESPDKEYDVVWMMDKLISRIEEKHKETMWVSAEVRGSRKEEEFRYTKVKHTKGVDPSALPILLEAGYMTIHYLIKQLPSGAAKDQGYLFKMAPKYIPILFEDTQVYDFV
jgi:hypothetical protein